jgi:predicted DCC family thiol-disulfide oxidoreductase YuxK
MAILYVLFDAQCGMCRGCAGWLQGQPAYDEIRLIPIQFEQALRKFEGLDRRELRDELHVITGQGAVYRGAAAWIMCLHALREYRPWAARLATPALMPLAQKVCELVSHNRLGISHLFTGLSDEQLVRHLQEKEAA